MSTFLEFISYRNESPTSRLECLGDLLLTPASLLLGGRTFTLVHNNDALLPCIYTKARQTPLWAIVVAAATLPISLVGLAFKAVSLLTSERTREIYLKLGLKQLKPPHLDRPNKDFHFTTTELRIKSQSHNIGDLPPELLQQIFHFAAFLGKGGSIRSVNRAWRTLFLDTQNRIFHTEQQKMLNKLQQKPSPQILELFQASVMCNKNPVDSITFEEQQDRLVQFLLQQPPELIDSLSSRSGTIGGFQNIREMIAIYKQTFPYKSDECDLRLYSLINLGESLQAQRLPWAKQHPFLVPIATAEHLICHNRLDKALWIGLNPTDEFATPIILSHIAAALAKQNRIDEALKVFAIVDYKQDSVASNSLKVLFSKLTENLRFNGALKILRIIGNRYWGEEAYLVEKFALALVDHKKVTLDSIKLILSHEPYCSLELDLLLPLAEALAKNNYWIEAFEVILQAIRFLRSTPPESFSTLLQSGDFKAMMTLAETIHNEKIRTLLISIIQGLQDVFPKRI